ncbi:tyrosine recombinase XerS [Rummeliibacillus stabekisii]|uniref:tyrosine recombinase XerS n=1 Tax=Rummeliibacillus stabekisii TaxID=241244 RepID=UPI001173F76B|nr:tyrosine recombinase XerS [Rummeliibacillus stabekisii]MBB5171542.1 site-specific recombinase XerD [Rummeliibacillus stabekisii]GEL05509.1 tyrosine recombinase XerS [Rummeliibacillus stabekisii]
MALTPEQQQVLALIDKHLEPMPFYVKEYILSKKRSGLAPNTLLQYLYRYRHFFNWLLSEGIVEAKDAASIDYKELEDMKKETIELYLDYLKEENIAEGDQVEHRGPAVVELSIHALKSLFNYLTKETEMENGECYFYRNVMNKIVIHKKRETANRRARNISSIILNEEEISEYLEFIKNDYGNLLDSPLAQRRFERDKERDIAINSLILGTGMRVGEIASIEVKKVHLNKGTIEVTRKGGTEDTVLVMESALKDLKEFMQIRNNRYKGAKDSPFLFVSVYGGTAKALSRRAIQNVVNKYTAAFGQSNGISPHKLRHSFAVDFIRNGGDIILLRDQLGHNDIKTTSLYTNMANKDSEKILNKMDQHRNKQ